MKLKLKLIASLKICAVIYPSITLFLYLFGEVLATMPLYQRTLLLTVTLVPWIVFIGVPFIDLVIRTISFTRGKDKQEDTDRAFQTTRPQ